MATVELKATARMEAGKGVARKTRREGSFPAVLYGKGEEPQPISVRYSDFYPVIRTAAGENVILDLEIDGPKKMSCKAIIRDIQYHPVKREILHADFQHISLTKEITVSVPIEIVGEAVGVKTSGGILEIVLREIEVECLPVYIPDAIRVDVSQLEVGNSVKAGDLKVENASMTTDAGSTVLTIVAPTVIEEVKPEVAEEGEEEKPAEEGEEAKKEGEAKAEETEKKPEK